MAFFTPPTTPLLEKVAVQALGATMWFWVFWRAKHDYKKVLVSVIIIISYHILFYFINFGFIYFFLFENFCFKKKISKTFFFLHNINFSFIFHYDLLFNEREF